MASYLLQERVVYDRSKLIEAEETFILRVRESSGAPSGSSKPASSGLATEIHKVRERINQTLTVQSEGGAGSAASDSQLQDLVNRCVQASLSSLKATVAELSVRVQKLELQSPSSTPQATPASAAKPAVEDDDDEDDEDIDLFGSDDEEADAEAERVKQERLAEYAAKKAKKPGPIAKSTLVLDVKPWDDETDLGEIEKAVRGIQMDGLVWGASKLEEIGYGIKKLRISCVVEDLKVSTDDLQEQIEAFEDLVQSTDVVAFNKV